MDRAYVPRDFRWYPVSVVRPDPSTKVMVFDQLGPTAVFDMPKTLDVGGSATVTLSDVQDIGETPGKGLSTGAIVGISAGVAVVGGVALWLALR